MNLIKQIYKGTLFPAESKYPTGTEYLHMRKELESKIERLNTMLDENGRQLLEDVLTLRVDMDSVTDVDTFVFGFKIGAEIMLEGGVKIFL
ncbi:MAG: hypothetical protein PHO15_03120 [Eubacteriales bacterium]|nr:hypothetical protein [Eubacteriales bacterium]